MRRKGFSTLKPKPQNPEEPKTEPRVVVAKGHEDTARERDHDIPCTD